MKAVIKRLLNEGLFDKTSKKQIALLDEFVDFACDFLKLDKPTIKLQFNHDGLVTTAAYGGNKVFVYAKERALVDIMRSIAHELTHMKQDSDGRLEQTEHEKNNAAGSPVENEANSKAGIMIRKFGEQHPEIYP
jgi:hypothetical protein